MEKKMQITIYQLWFRVWGLGIEMAMQESPAKSTIFFSRMWCVGMLMQKVKPYSVQPLQRIM